MRHAPLLSFFFFNDTATTEIYTLSLHDALPISSARQSRADRDRDHGRAVRDRALPRDLPGVPDEGAVLRALRMCLRSEEHTSELQSLAYLVCRLLLEKKKNTEIAPAVALTLSAR